MLRVRTDQIWELLYQDKTFQKELNRQQKDNLEKREKLYHDLEHATPKQKEKIEAKIQMEKDKIFNFRFEQMDARGMIVCRESDIDLFQKQEKEMKEKIHDEKRNLTIAENNLQEWDLTIENQKQRFYQNAFQQVNDDYQSLQDLIVRNLQSKKKMTKSEAKVKTNAVIIDEDQISKDPPGRARRLTKDEKEKYHNTEEL